MFQIIRTDKKGRITGDTFSDPREAISQFITDGKDKTIYAEVIFRVWGQLVFTPMSDKITFVSLNRINGSDDWMVSFSCEEINIVNQHLEAMKISEGHVGRYYQDMVIIDISTGKVLGELHQ